MAMDKIIINAFLIWQMAMGKISAFTTSNFTFPSFAALSTSFAKSCAKSFSCVLHVSPKGRRGGTRALPGPSLRCSKSSTRHPPGGGGGGSGGGCAWCEACIYMLMSTNLQHLWVSVWGGTRVLGVSPKGSVGAACVCWAYLKIWWESVRLISI